MKKLIVGASLVAAAVGALAQGQFQFANLNANTTPVIDAPVRNSDGTLLEGTAFLANAYIKLATDPDSSYSPVGGVTPFPFRTGTRAGYIVPIALTTTYAHDTEINVEFRAWEAAGGTSYDAAKNAGFKYGKSAPVTLKVQAAPFFPADMIGLQGFSLVPEPSTMALGVLGAAALLLRRRR